MLFSIFRCQSTRTPFNLFSTDIPRRPFSFHATNQSRRFSRSPRWLNQDRPTEFPSFRETLKRTKPTESFSEKVGRPGIRNQVLFVAFGSLFAFTYAATRTNIETEFWRKRLVDVSSVWSFKAITNADLKRIQNVALVTRLREIAASINQGVQEIPALIRPWIGLAYVSVAQPWADASEGKRAVWKLCLFNAAVYLAWKIRKWQPIMNRSFMHNPLSGLSFTLLTSMFSHKSFLHLLCNCLALESFGSAAYFYLMREQTKAEPPMLESTSAFHFLAFFIAAGLFSGLVSHVVSTKLLYPRIINQLAAAARSKPKPDTWAAALASSAKTAKAPPESTIPSILPSLGASGAIYATLTMTALAFPDSEAALFIPPNFTVNIQSAVMGLVALDTIGILRGWRLFDHWAHLGGAAFGVFYYTYGPEFWNKLRKYFNE